MATDIGELLVKLSADLKGLDSGLKTAKGQLAGFQNHASSFASALKKTLAFAGVAVGLYEIASAVKAFAQDAAMVGARTETLAISSVLRPHRERAPCATSVPQQLLGHFGPRKASAEYATRRR